MSSLWTPGGEIPVDRSAPEPADPPETEPRDHAAAGGGPDEAAIAAEYERMRRELLEAPAADVIAQHAMGLYELAAMHLSQPDPRLADARLAIDALTALLEGLAGRLGASEAPLTGALPQLKMAYVEATDHAAKPEAHDP